MMATEQVSATRITAEPGVPYIDMERDVDAPRDLVFRAFSEPELLAQWLGPRRYEMIVERYDVRDGGSWRYVHRDENGAEFGFHGVFHGPQTIDGMTQTFEFEGAPGHVSLDSLTFEDLGGRTRIRTHSVYQSIMARDAMIEGGMATGITEGFERLDALLATMTAAVH
jgi:uncharacterized protein YndB with AHSA1/START domain